MSIKEEFFIVKYKADGNGCPYFSDVSFTPDLPDYDIDKSAPDQGKLSSVYKVRMKKNKLDGDFIIEDHIASEGFLNICTSMNVPFVYADADVLLSKIKKPNKKYFIFFPSKYLSIINEEESIYSISIDIYSNLPNTPKDRGLYKTFYEKIDFFKIKKGIKYDLFYCLDISELVCSEKFKKKIELGNFKGFSFINIDEDFKYDPWSNWLR